MSYATNLDDINNLNYIGDDDDGGPGVLDYNGFTPASKIAYESVFDLDLDLSSFPGNMHTLGDMVVFYNAHNINAVAGQTTLGELKPKDIVQLKNTDSAFLVYLGKNSNGNIILEDLYYQFECSPQAFDLLFTGNAILINHPATKITAINANSINDDPIHDENIHDGNVS